MDPCIKKLCIKTSCIKYANVFDFRKYFLFFSFLGFLNNFLKRMICMETNNLKATRVHIVHMILKKYGMQFFAKLFIWTRSKALTILRYIYNIIAKIYTLSQGMRFSMMQTLLVKLYSIFNYFHTMNLFWSLVFFGFLKWLVHCYEKYQ